MGTRAAPNFANVYIWAGSKTDLYTRHTGMSMYWTGYGFIDDLFMIWFVRQCRGALPLT